VSDHPPGLRTLFFTEMWERFSYYGMRAMLVLFMADAVQGGMGLTVETATAIYGLYTAGVYLSALPGGWVADRLLGARRAVWIGGIIIACGHLLLALPGTSTFFIGLFLIVVGTGLLKPNISVLVGELYPEGGARRDAGFTIFYMGINIGAALGPLVCSYLGEKLNWHVGFAAAGAGMVVGLIQFRLSAAQLGASPSLTRETVPPPRSQLLALGLGFAGIVIAGVLLMTGTIRINPVALAQGTAALILLVAVLYFGGIYLFGALQPLEKKRIHVVVLFFLSSAVFWAGFEQVGSTLNLFADRYTDRTIGTFVIPTGWFQSLGPIFVITFAPVAAAVWLALARRGKEPSMGFKFAIALFLLAAGFAVMAGAAAIVGGGAKAGPIWLILTYLLHTFGELCLSPVGLSSVTKLAPQKFVGQLMGTWFLGTSLGNLLSGLLAGRISSAGAPTSTSFVQMLVLPLVVGVLLLSLVPVVKRWSGGVR
jgi:proton-dependent oligopeptide transporter, POT family